MGKIDPAAKRGERMKKEAPSGTPISKDNRAPPYNFNAGASYADAAKLSGLGFCVIPVRFKEKIPALTEWSTYKTRKPTDEELHAWFDRGNRNIAVVCGAVSGNLVVIDFDDQNAMRFVINDLNEIAKKTMIVRTGKGLHIYMRLTNPANFRLQNLKIDVKGEGGFVLAPPSVHPSGRQYTHIGTMIIEEKTEKESQDLLGYLHKADEEYPMAKVVAGVWRSGNRHEIALGIAALLKTQGWSVNETSNFLRSVMRMLSDTEEIEDRTRAVEDAYKNHYPPEKHLGRELLSEIQKVMPSNKGGALRPDAWFTGEDEAKKFVPYLCAKDYLRAYPHVVTEYSGLIHQFIGKHWLKATEGFVYSTIENAGKGLIRPRQISEAVESLRNQTRIIDPDKLNLTMEQILPMPEYSIPIENGILNMLSKTLQPFSPDFYYTEVLPRNYIPGAVPEVFLQFLGKIFLGDPDAELKITQIFETIAWTLTMNYDIQGAVILYGEGGEGKSIIHAIIADTIGHTTSISLTELEEDKFKRAELYGSWANLVSESSSDIVISEWFKRLTDGTTITAERKNRHPFQFSSHAKLILDVNELPNEEGQLRAFYRRVALIIDFPNMLENVLTPQEIDNFVKKLKDPSELDKIFSFVVDNYYAPLAKKMKFTGHLTLEDAEKKWIERSNPALTYIQVKHADGQIFTDVEDVKAILQDDIISLSRYITIEKDGMEHLTMIKQDVINAARKWAADRGLPAKTIDGGALGRALVSLGYPNYTVSKKINKTTILRAWEDIFINISEDTGYGQVTGRETPPLPPQTQSNSDGNAFSYGGRFQRSVSFFEKGINIREDDRKRTRNLNSKTLDNTEENPVTVGSGHLLPSRNPTSGAYNSESPTGPLNSSVQSENENNASSITLETGSINMDVKKSPILSDSEHEENLTADPLKFDVQSETQPITEKDGKLFVDKLLNLGYHVDPNSGPDINQKFFVIRIAGFSSLSSEMRENLLFVMAKEHFTMAAGGSHSMAFARPLASASDSAGNSVQSDPESIRYEIVEIIRTEAPKTQYGTMTPEAVHRIIGARFKDITPDKIKELCEQEYDRGTLIRRGPGYFFNSEGA